MFFCNHGGMKKILILALLLTSCSSATDRQECKRRKNNRVEEKIYRLSDEYFYVKDDAILVERDLYPWETKSSFSKITISDFRCRGSEKNQKLSIGKEIISDCNGLHDHGLPYKNGKEFVYPVLVEILNFVQEATGRQVIVLSGHRCPIHHKYVTSGRGRLSKHMIGARADFYLKGYKVAGEQILKTIESFYKEESSEYRHFFSIQKKDGGLIYKNKEIKLYLNSEKNLLIDKIDEQVITIEVCYDREENQEVVLDWDKAYRGYIRN